MDLVAAAPGAAPFVGRRAELDRLGALIAGAAEGAPAAVLLGGDAGVGKTSLAAEFGRRARRDGALVLVGHNVDLGTGGLPYLPFAEALTTAVRGVPGSEDLHAAARAVVEESAERRPVLRRLLGQAPSPLGGENADGGLDRLALFDAVAEVLSELSIRVAPVVLVVEDLHWAEQSSRDVVRFLLSRLGLGDARILVLATYRGEDLHRRHPVRALLAELQRLPAVELMELQPFGVGELAEFLTAVHGSALPPDTVRRIGDRSAGNAYYAEELLAAGPDGKGLPTGLADVLLDRLERLSSEAQQLVRVAAVLGSSRVEDGIVRAIAAESVSLTDADVDAALREVVTHSVLLPDHHDRFAFRHALLQEAVYSDLLPAERVRLHALAAAQLGARAGTTAGRMGDAAERARHSLAARDLPQALEATLSAAAAARERLAPAEAFQQYQQALELWPVVDPDRRPAGHDQVTIALTAADVAGDCGRHFRAVDVAADAVAMARAAGDRTGMRQALSRLAAHEAVVDRYAEAQAHAWEVIEDHEGTADGGVAVEPTAALVRARAVAGRIAGGVGDPNAAIRLLKPGLEEARHLGLAGAEADILISLAQADRMLGDPNADEYLEQARAAATASGERATMLRAAYITVVDHFEEGDFDGALAAIAQTLEWVDALGLSNSAYAINARWMRVHAYWMQGDPDAALAVIAADGAHLSNVGKRQLRLAGLPILAARSPRQALAEADELEATDPNTANAPNRWFARAEAYASLGDSERSVDCAERAIETLDAIGEQYALAGIAISTCAVAVLADLAAAARTVRDAEAEARAIERARSYVTDARDRGAKGRPRRFRLGPEGVAWLARLDVEQARLTGADTAAEWERATSAFGFGAVYEQARCRWRWAQRLLADGARDAAREQVELARAAALRVGAEPLLAALDDLARRGRLGAQPGRSGVLTARERDVMRLVAQGLTNRVIGERLFISEKTASVHVSNVLTKLGASGRTEAVAIATREGLLD